MRHRRTAAAHALLYITTGIWPLLHRRSFERITGPKVDFWLVESVGSVTTAIGLGLAQAVVRGRPVPRELRTVAVGSALGLATIDSVHVARRRISPIYLVDAAAELALVAGWLRPGADRGQAMVERLRTLQELQANRDVRLAERPHPMP